MSLLGHIIAAAGGPRVTLDATYNPNALAFSPGVATASFSLQDDGDIEASNSVNPPADIGDWISPKAAAGAAYECRMSTVSGTLTSGTVGSWEALSTTRTWTKQRTIEGTAQYVGTLEIRLAGSGAVVVTSTVTFDATVTTI